MIASLLLFAVGLALSAFFSGSETGFYRATRVRLLIRALSGSWSARGLVWMMGRPSLFVGTALVGNNIANYTTSLAVVMGAQRLAGGDQPGVELAASLCLAPLVFLYGELLPKDLFYQAPNRLLVRCGPAFLLASAVLAPATLLVWLTSRLLQLIVRRSPQEIRLVLARRELAGVLEEGHEIGILHPSQQALIQGTFSLAGQPVRQFATPAGRFSRVTTNTKRRDILRVARRQRRTLIPVEEPRGRRQLLGYLRVADLALTTDGEELPLRPAVTLRESETCLAALARLLAADYALGHVVDARGRTSGFVTAEQLTEALLGGWGQAGSAA